ncbi:hypothetical protein QBC39DRAFT_407805 [Podospora conica]|nr:hypothetical protein QBC39DRAFT_407805 [Schizothecium conicum]
MSAPDLLAALGVPDVASGRRFSPLQPDHASPPQIKDYFGARELLDHLRTIDPSYKPPKEQKRGFLTSKKKKDDLGDPSSWSFPNPELGRAVTFALRNNLPGADGIVAALLAMGAKQGATAELLWTSEQQQGQKTLPSLLKLIRLQKPASTTEEPCPWLQIAAELGSLALVHVLWRAGLSQKCLDNALAKAIHIGNNHRVEKELVALGANFPADPKFLATFMSSASSERALQATKLFLSTQIPPQHSTAIAAMKRAAKTIPTDNNLQETLSILLANVILAPLESYEVLLAAIDGQNLGAVATISHAIRHHWGHIAEAGGSEATRLAAQVDDLEIRFRLLNFLRLVGATPDTPELRERFLQDAKSGHLDHLNLLLLFGVSPATPTANSDAGTLGWTVQSLNMVVFDLILATELTPQEASAALHHLPEHAPHDTKMKIIRSLAERGASPEELSHQLLVAVRNSERYLIEMLLGLGAAPVYRDRGGASALSIAAGLGNVPLVNSLCLNGAPPGILSEAMPHAVAGLCDRQNDLISVLRLLVSKGANGPCPSVDGTVLEVLDNPGPATDEILKVLLPLGLGPVAAGGAAKTFARPAWTANTLGLLCRFSTIPETALGSALQIVLGHESINMEKARLLSGFVKAAGWRHIFDHLLVYFHGDEHSNGHQIVDFLLASGASIDAGEGCVLAAEASRGNLARLGEMMIRKPSQVTLGKTLKECLSLPPSTRANIIRLILGATTSDIGQGAVALRAVQDEDLALLRIVMDLGHKYARFPYKEALWDAIDHLRDQAVSVFIHPQMNKELATSALEHLMSGRSLEDPRAVRIAASLLKAVDSSAKDVALRKAFSAVTVSGAFPAGMIQLLVNQGGNACLQAGLLFRMASQKGDIAALRALAIPPFPLDSVVRAVIESADKGSARYVGEALKVCLAQATTDRLEDNSLLKLALEKYPTSEEIVTVLLNNGCTASTDCGFLDNDGFVMLPFTWALNNQVSDKVIVKLLSATPKPDWLGIPSAAVVKMIYAAAAREEPTVFDQFRGAQIDCHHSDGTTALSLATSDGNLQAIKRLTDAGSRTNDGSLHIAAAQRNAEAIKLLRASGHDLNWPSATDGLIPVMCLIENAEGLGPAHERALEDALASLTPFPQPKCHQGEPSILHHILDQWTCSVPLLRAYARVTRLHDQSSKDDVYLFKEPRTKLCYSPTAYLQYIFPERRNPMTVADLLSILRGLGFEDRYYAESGPQPLGYTPEALPQSVKYAMEREQEAEQERRRLNDQRQYLDQERQRLNNEAEADEARYLKALMTRGNVEVDLAARKAHAATMAAIPAYPTYVENYAQYPASGQMAAPTRPK